MNWLIERSETNFLFILEKQAPILNLFVERESHQTICDFGPWRSMRTFLLYSEQHGYVQNFHAWVLDLDRNINLMWGIKEAILKPHVTELSSKEDSRLVTMMVHECLIFLHK